MVSVAMEENQDVCVTNSIFIVRRRKEYLRLIVALSPVTSSASNALTLSYSIDVTSKHRRGTHIPQLGRNETPGLVPHRLPQRGLESELIECSGPRKRLSIRALPRKQ